MKEKQFKTFVLFSTQAVLIRNKKMKNAFDQAMSHASEAHDVLENKTETRSMTLTRMTFDNTQDVIIELAAHGRGSTDLAESVHSQH